MSPTTRAPEAQVRDLSQFPDLAVLVQAPEMTILQINEQAVVELGWQEIDVVGRSLREFSDPDERGLNEQLIAEALAGKTVRFDRMVRHGDGSWRNYNFAARALADGSRRFLLVGREIDALAHSHSKLADLLMLANLSDDVFIVSDADGVITYANAAAARAHGAFAFVGQQLSEFIHEDDVGYPHLLKAMVARDGRAEARVMAKRGDGSPVMMDVRTVYDADTQRWFTVERDISQTIEDERRMAQLTRDLRRQAMTDNLTGVANRHALNEHLELAIAEERPFAVMLLDMDDFKSVNDTLGHDAGDAFLRCIADRLRRVVKNTDLVARFGGDEFVVFLPGVNAEFAAGIAERVIAAIGEEIEIAGHRICRTSSIGVAVHVPGEDAPAVLRKADRAVYQAKREGRCRFAIL